MWQRLDHFVATHHMDARFRNIRRYLAIVFILSFLTQTYRTTNIRVVVNCGIIGVLFGTDVAAQGWRDGRLRKVGAISIIRQQRNIDREPSHIPDHHAIERLWPPQ